MSIVLGIVDSDLERRQQTLRLAEGYMNSHFKMTQQKWSYEDLTVLAATNEPDSISQHRERASFTWTIGDVYNATDQSPAVHLSKLIETHGPLSIHGQSGFYLACSVDHSGQVTLGTDILGIFPVYYWSDGRVLLFSTVPRLIHFHPNFRKRISPEGLAGILLQSYIANCQTIWEGIRRPEPGHALQWQSGSLVRSMPANQLQPSEEFFDLEYGQARELLDTQFQRAVARCARGSRKGLMLSGGIDSRLVAANLHVISPATTQGFVFGDIDDNEVYCAQHVARSLDLPLHRLPVLFESFKEQATTMVEEEHMSNTFHDFSWLSGADRLRSHCSELIAGFFGDAVMGGSQIHYHYNHRRGVYDFDGMFATCNVYGFTPEEMALLVRDLPMFDAAQSCIDKMRSAYEAFSGLPFQKATLWSLYHRQRFHVGPFCWRLSKTVWPLMPYLDRSLLETCLAMPMNYLAQRQMQIDILKWKYRNLAVLPIDRNSYNTRPLIETRRYEAARIMRKWRRKLLVGRKEQRIYYRVFDINNPGWIAIRQTAAARLGTAQHIFNPNVLAKYLPSPTADISCADTINSSARLKTLAGLMILSEHLVE